VNRLTLRVHPGQGLRLVFLKLSPALQTETVKGKDVEYISRFPLNLPVGAVTWVVGCGWGLGRRSRPSRRCSPP